MTGTEAISNAVPAFKPPESSNAAITLGVMAGILGFSARRCHRSCSGPARGSVEDGSDTVLSQIGRAVYGDGGFFYFALQIATMAILILGGQHQLRRLPSSFVGACP